MNQQSQAGHHEDLAPAASQVNRAAQSDNASSPMSINFILGSTTTSNNGKEQNASGVTGSAKEKQIHRGRNVGALHDKVFDRGVVLTEVDLEVMRAIEYVNQPLMTMEELEKVLDEFYG